MTAFLCISIAGCAGTGEEQNKNDADTETGGGQDTEDTAADVILAQPDSRQSDNDEAGQPEDYGSDTWYVKDGQKAGLNEQIEKEAGTV